MKIMRKIAEKLIRIGSVHRLKIVVVFVVVEEEEEEEERDD